MTSAEKRTILEAAIARAYTAIAETPGAGMKEERFGYLLHHIVWMEDAAAELNGSAAEQIPEAPKAEEPKPALTKDEVKAKLLALSDQYDDLDVSVVMESMGYSKLSDIPADKYSLLLDKVAEVVKELA